MDNFNTEIELLELRAQNNEEKFRRIDATIIDEIKKRSSGQRQKYLIQAWRNECQLNEEISVKRWQKTEEWAKRYEENFIEIYKNTNPFIKQIALRNEQQPKSYADAVKRTANKPTKKPENQTKVQRKNYRGNVTNPAGRQGQTRRQLSQDKATNANKGNKPVRRPRQDPDQQDQAKGEERLNQRRGQDKTNQRTITPAQENDREPPREQRQPQQRRRRALRLNNTNRNADVNDDFLEWEHLKNSPDPTISNTQI
ncbi:MAG: hypothetical protein AB2693_31810 [Candidatus Thiodiazotropha sp.]